MSFDVWLSHAVPFEVTVSFSAFDGETSPASGFQLYVQNSDGSYFQNTGSAARQVLAFAADYLQTPPHIANSVAFAPGETRRTVTVEILQGPLVPDAPEESFVVTLLNPVNAVIGDGTATGTIIDQTVPLTAQPAITVQDVQGAEPSSGGFTPLVFRVSLDAPSSSPVTVQYAASSGSAVAEQDFKSTGGSLIFAPGERERFVDVLIQSDILVEADETLSFVLSAPVGASLNRATATGTILDSPASPLPSEDYFAVTAGGVSGFTAGSVYSGPVEYLQRQFLGSQFGDAAGGTGRSDFINLLAGDDAANGQGGDDVLDGGVGSNFLTGGAGRDVFFLDGRGSGVTWGTITDWSEGEQLSLWGWRPGVSQATWVDSGGVGAFRGVTLHVNLDADGPIDASVTWSGVTHAQLPVAQEFDGLLWFT
jgi:hypothetical protein